MVVADAKFDTMKCHMFWESEMVFDYDLDLAA